MTIRGARAPRSRFRRAAAGLIGACGAYQLVLGAYFVALRPPLLPGDLRFLGTTTARLVVDLPRLERWLDLVFVVLGGQMVALGMLLAAFAVRLAQRTTVGRRELVLLGLAGVLAVALMSAVNFALGSNFRWLFIFPVRVWSMGVALAAAGLGAAPGEAGERLHGR